MNYVDVPYLFLDFSQILVADTPMNFFSRQKFSLYPLTALLGHPAQALPKIFLDFVAFLKRFLGTPGTTWVPGKVFFSLMTY